MRITFSRGLVATIAVLGLTACSAEATETGDSDELTKLTVGRITASQYTPVELGMTNGYFAENGLEIELIDMQGAGPSVSALESGSIDLFNNTPIVAAAANEAGSDLRVFCAGSTQAVTFLTREDGPIETATQENWKETVRGWEGSTIGIPVLGGNAEFIAMDLIAQAGLAPDSVEIVAVGPPTSAAAEQLNDGEIDILYSWPYFTEILSEETRVALSLTSVGPEELVSQRSALWTADAKWLDENAETAELFCQLYADLIEQATDPANAEDVEQILISEGGVVPADAARIRERALADGGGLTILTAEMTCESVVDALALSVASGELKPETVENCEDLVWTAP